MEVLQDRARTGLSDAQLQLGEAYEKGIGIQQSDVDAAHWYLAAAEQGNSAAEVNLGVLYWTGRGVDQDKAEAVRWYRRAAYEGNAAAMYNLGVACFNGEGVSCSQNDALVWFVLGEDGGSQQAAEAVKRSETNLAAHDMTEVYLEIGERYELGQKGLKQSYAAAAKWYQRGAEQNEPRAAVALARLYAAGRGVPKNYRESLHWCKVAAERGSVMGMYCAGKLYRDGAGTPKNPALALQYLQASAEAGYADASHELARMYWNGEGVPSDHVQAYLVAQRASPSNPEIKKDVEEFRTLMTADELKIANKKLKKPSLRNPTPSN
jgi:TPR repeat protein